MKKLIAITILVSLLSSTTELHEFLKIPGLLKHYYEHVTDDQKSISGFIYDHYLSSTPHQDPDDDEEPLPFHGNDVCMVFVSLSYCFTNNPTFDRIDAVESSSNFQNYTESIHSNYQANIWQPPKIG